ncbi:MAG: GNAT family N-acetyltransferase [Gaiellaceae bacterium]
MIETERLVLRKPRPEDVDAFLEFVGDAETMRWLGDGPGGHDAAARLVERWLARWEENRVGYFVVLLDGRAIGRVGLNVWDLGAGDTSTYALAGEHAQPELAWGLTSRYWGRGYATEAARAVRDWARRERAIERPISMIEPANTASARVAERLGAGVEGQVTTVYGPMDVWRHPS